MATQMSPDENRKRRANYDVAAPSKRTFTEKVRGLKFLVPDYAAGAIIGKAGKNITEHKEKFGTLVKMSSSREYFPMTNERICLVIGDRVELDQMIACFKYLIQVIRDEADDFEKRKNPKDADRKDQVKLLLTNNTAGLIIGKGGETIKDIQEQTGTRIMITPFDPDLDERVCTISAEDYSSTIKATDVIMDKVTKDPEGHVSRNLIYSSGGYFQPASDPYSQYGRGYGGGYDRRGSGSGSGTGGGSGSGSGGYDRGFNEYSSTRYTDDRGSSDYGYGYGVSPAPASSLGGSVYVLDDRDPRNLILGIMEQYVGGLVGRNGATISELQTVSRTHIQISHKDEYIAGTRDRKVTIKGEPQAVHAAYMLICDKVSRNLITKQPNTASTNVQPGSHYSNFKVESV